MCQTKESFSFALEVAVEIKQTNCVILKVNCVVFNNKQQFYCCFYILWFPLLLLCLPKRRMVHPIFVVWKVITACPVKHTPLFFYWISYSNANSTFLKTCCIIGQVCQDCCQECQVWSFGWQERLRGYQPGGGGQQDHHVHDCFQESQDDFHDGLEWLAFIFKMVMGKVRIDRYIGYFPIHLQHLLWGKFPE